MNAKEFRASINRDGLREELFGALVGWDLMEPNERIRAMAKSGIVLFPDLSDENKARLLYIEDEP